MGTEDDLLRYLRTGPHDPRVRDITLDNAASGLLRAGRVIAELEARVEEVEGRLALLEDRANDT